MEAGRVERTISEGRHSPSTGCTGPRSGSTLYSSSILLLSSFSADILTKLDFVCRNTEGRRSSDRIVVVDQEVRRRINTREKRELRTVRGGVCSA
jgi:hypothetical protein